MARHGETGVLLDSEKLFGKLRFRHGDDRSIPAGRPCCGS